ncbi:E3 UFM1-protein ligase 1-like [Watersipora subatra]|uniref:E3 UFM1-protein ligase 1-like n=1 Tax=Watersipora subatra TaxID=2589382 RepID=UPI00355B2920
MAATWDEIKRLASDFQRAQLSSTSQRLAERNCHELVDRLVALGLIEVIYTSDAKCYLTSEELSKEITEEVIAHGGRVNLVAVQQATNVSMTHVESTANRLVASDPELQLVLGQLIHVSYLDKLAADVNYQLQNIGQITFGQLTKDYDLPGDFLRKEITRRLGTHVFGKVNPNNNDVLYTEAYINRHRAKIRGIFSALTRPTSIASIVSRCNLPEQLLQDLLKELITSHRLRGSLSSNKSMYTPDIYTRAQSDWVKNFYAQNGYLEYKAVTRLGVSDPRLYIKKLYSSAVLLNACCISESCLETLEEAIEEAIAANTYVDALSVLPSVVSPIDAAQLVQMSVRTHKAAVVLADTVVTTQHFINSCVAPFETLMQEKAQKDMKMNASVFADTADRKTLLGSGDDTQSRKEERKKKAAATSKSGGGTQGREVKSKAVKNKFRGRGGANRDSDDEDTPTVSLGPRVLHFMTVKQISEVIGKLPQLEDCADVVVDEIAGRLERPLRDKYQQVAKSLFTESSAASTPGGSSKRKVQADLEEKVNALYSNIRLFEKSIRVITDDEELQTNLTKYLLKTLCSELFNATLVSIANDNMVSIPNNALESVEGRAKVISNLPDEVKEVAGKVHTALNGKSMEAYDEALLALLSPKHVGILLKKADKKRDRQIQFNHRMTLIESLKEEGDADIANVFHQCVVLLYSAVYQSMLHCSGRMIPSLVKQLKERLSPQNYILLTTCQDLIIQQVKGSIASDDERLLECIAKVKDIAMTLKKSETGGSSQD